MQCGTPQPHSLHCYNTPRFGAKRSRVHELPSWHCYHAPTLHAHMDTIVMYDALKLSRIGRSSPANEIRGSSDSIATVAHIPRGLNEGSCGRNETRQNPTQKRRQSRHAAPSRQCLLSLSSAAVNEPLHTQTTQRRGLVEDFRAL
jgi:hypothetical protein